MNTTPEQRARLKAELMKSSPRIRNLFRPQNKPVVVKSQQLSASAEEKGKPHTWPEVIKAVFELKRKKGL